MSNMEQKVLPVRAAQAGQADVDTTAYRRRAGKEGRKKTTKTPRNSGSRKAVQKEGSVQMMVIGSVLGLVLGSAYVGQRLAGQPPVVLVVLVGVIGLAMFVAARKGL